MTKARPDVLERLRLRSVELLVLVAVVFIAVRVTLPRQEGARVLAREARVLAALRAIHAAQADAAADGACRWLSGLAAAADAASPLRTLTRRPPVADVELHELDGYLLAVYLPDPGRPDDRAWSASMASGEDRPFGYGAFAWPARYGPSTQWAFFVDHRGKLLGSWNHAGLLDGTQDPFPPAAHPLRAHLAAQKEGEDAEWVSFDELSEIVSPLRAER